MCDRVMVIVDGRLAAFDTTAAPAGAQPLLPHRLADRRRRAGGAAGVRWRAWRPRWRRARRERLGSSRGGAQAARAGRVPDRGAGPQRRARLLHRRPAEERHDGAVRDAARATRRSSCPTSKEPWFFAEELHERTPAAPGRDADDARAVPRAVRARRGPEQRVGEAIGAVPVVAHRRARDRRGARPDARIVAILREPASLLRSLHLQFVRDLRRDRGRPAHGARAGGRSGARAGSIPRHTYWPQALLYSEHVRYVEQLRRYHELFGRGAGAGADLRRLPRRQRGDRAPRCCASSRWTTRVPIEPVEANPTVRPRSQRLHELAARASRSGAARSRGR